MKGVEKDRLYWNKVKGEKKVKRLRKYYEALGYEVNTGEVEEEGVDMIAVNHEEKRIEILEITNWRKTSYAGYGRVLRFCQNLEKVAKVFEKRYPDYLVERVIVVSYHSNLDSRYYPLLETYLVGLDVDGELPLTKEDGIPEDFKIEWVE